MDKENKSEKTGYYGYYYDSRICSVHLADVDLVKRKTSPQHPYPTIEMGYELSGERAKQKRKQPTCRLNSPPLK